MANPKYAAYEAADPYFDLVRGALGDLVDGAHFFDILADTVVYEVLYDVPGWPRVIHGRADLMARFRGYVDAIALQSADNRSRPQRRGCDCVRGLSEYEVARPSRIPEPRQSLYFA